jgi:deoxyribodipyrimidine photo-lyase
METVKNIIWFKKDLRADFHEPLTLALESGSSLGLYIIEDEWLESYESSNFHKQFLRETLLDLKKDLNCKNIPFIVCRGEVLDVLKRLKQKYNFDSIYSHEETGLKWTYERDLKVQCWTKGHSIDWFEFPQFGVFRGLKNRDEWVQKREDFLRKTFQYKAHQSIRPAVSDFIDLSALDVDFNPFLQKGGRGQGLKTLKTFLNNRFVNYSKGLSSPNSAVEDCSRISPYLSWGNLSLLEVHQRLQIRKKEVGFGSQGYRCLKSFENRLWWHCHFIQKLETNYKLEFQNTNIGFDGMREKDFNESYFEAWKKGETGFPLIDACMKSLHKTGWINFRMRALLVSFASYQLWLHWEKPAQYLSGLFTDFEPGIHYSQFHMQSGVTGINAIRIYSPLKQSLDQDPEGVFIKTHLPILSDLDSKDVHDPSLSPPMMRALSNVKLGENYPNPIVDAKSSYNRAKELIFEWRQKPEVKRQVRGVLESLASRPHKNFPKQNRKKAFGNFSS